MKEALKAGGALGLAGVIVFGAVRLMLGGLFDGLNAAKIADVMTLVLFGFVFGALLIVFFALVMWRVKNAPSGQVIGGEYRVMPQPGQALQLAAPYTLPSKKTVNVPRVFSWGQPRPDDDEDEGLTAIQQAKTELSTVIVSEGGQRQDVRVMAEDLKKFILTQWPKPSRSTWRGDVVAYGRAAAFLIEHGFMTRQGKRFEWADQVNQDRLMRWLVMATGEGVPAAYPAPQKKGLA